MDKIVAVASILAIVAILSVTLILNPFAPPSPLQEGAVEESDGTGGVVGTAPEPESEGDEATHPEININQATIESIITPKVSGNCTLYKHVVKNKWECFGTAGNFSKIATNEYRPAESDTYFCRPTEYGYKLYQRVDFQLG